MHLNLLRKNEITQLAVTANGNYEGILHLHLFNKRRINIIFKFFANENDFFNISKIKSPSGDLGYE